MIADTTQNCPICNHSTHWYMPFMDQESGQSVMRKTGYAWHLCTRCGSGYPSVAANLDDLQNYWHINRLVSVPDLDDQAVWERRIAYSRYWADKSWQTLQPFLSRPQKRFLDIACGLGLTVRKFHEQGWQSMGIDADPNTQRFHQQFDVDCVIGQFERYQMAGPWDVISIAHAIYFVDNPRAFFARVKENLAPGGIFLVIVSDFASVLADALPSQVHTWYPSGGAMQYALHQHGFEVLKKEQHHGSIFFLAKPTQSSVAARINHWDLLRMRWQRVAYLWCGRPALHLFRTTKRWFQRWIL
ncbi:hypothetical protein SIID45300_01819 [Candidatus Magnetaquicoccaceae bacterium FCR-1]|uniref:Uncharacterized protein n=1 Tax=Candidatus Magnetaquiglobus chichijimensis TaxID=3141448 RepID=A0ABQ0C9E1_9PROT